MAPLRHFSIRDSETSSHLLSESRVGFFFGPVVVAAATLIVTRRHMET